MKQFTSKSQIIGQKGEQIAEMFLVKRGFTVLEKNYTKKIGEIDIVAMKGKSLHFVEVKSLVVDNVSPAAPGALRGEHETNYNPFENIGKVKFRKFSRTCEWYLMERHVPRETPWVIDAIAVVFVKQERKAVVRVLWNAVM